MSEELINVLINWAPMLLLIAVWVFFMLQMRGKYTGKYQKDYMEVAMRQADALERIAAVLEKKPG